MTDENSSPISLDDARQLVTFLEQGDNEAARALLEATKIQTLWSYSRRLAS